MKLAPSLGFFTIKTNVQYTRPSILLGCWIFTIIQFLLECRSCPSGIFDALEKPAFDSKPVFVFAAVLNKSSFEGTQLAGPSSHWRFAVDFNSGG